MDLIEAIDRLTEIIKELTDICNKQAKLLEMHGIRCDSKFENRIKSNN